MTNTILNKYHMKHLSKSAIRPNVAEACGVYSEKNAKTLSAFIGMDYSKFSESNHALVFPYYCLTEKREIVAHSVRPDKPKDLKRKYIKRKHAPNRLYVPKTITLEKLNDTSIPLLIAEGEKKALAGVSCGKLTVSIGGVTSWKTKYERPNGDTEPLKEFYQIPLKNRKVYICFDSDIATNINIVKAETKFAKFLTSEMGAEVYCVRIS